MHQEPIIDDLSSSESLPDYKKKLIDEELIEVQDRRIFKRILFYGIGISSVALLFSLLIYISLPFMCNSFALRIELPERLMTIGILATMAIVLPLALLRVIYQPTKNKEDSGDSVSIWYSLIREFIEVLKKYVDNKSN